MVSFERPSLERKGSNPFPHGVFGLCRWAREGRGLFCFVFCLVSPGQGGNSSCTTWTPKFPPPPLRRGQASRRLSTLNSARAETQLAATPIQRHALLPRTASASALDCPHPRRPQPGPVFPARILPAGGGLEWSGGGHLRQDGYDLGHGNCDLHVLVPVALASSSVCVLAV